MNEPRDPRDRKRLVTPRKVAVTRPQVGRLATTSRPRGDRGVAVSRYTEPLDKNPHTNSKKNPADRGVAEDAAALGERVEQVLLKNSERKKAKADRARTAKHYPKVGEANELWAEVYKEQFGEHPATGATGDNWSAFRRNTQRNPIENLEEFFADVCNSWSDLKAGPLSWMDNFPDAPNLQFLCHMIRYIRAPLEDEKFHTRKEKESLESLGDSTREAGRRLGEAMRSTGYTVGELNRAMQALSGATQPLPQISYSRLHSNPAIGDRYVEYDIKNREYLVYQYNGTDDGWIDLCRLTREEGDVAKRGKFGQMNLWVLGQIVDEKLGTL